MVGKILGWLFGVNTTDMQCGKTINADVKYNICVRPRGHDDYHQAADGLIWWDKTPAKNKKSN